MHDGSLTEVDDSRAEADVGEGLAVEPISSDREVEAFRNFGQHHEDHCFGVSLVMWI
ncbi:uncharacterized protein G2W53_017866 [Senna tora]|uniref:Uncharacterized protein n=1 Tax=Senna tora TaxID=362788 RepID=A0A834WKV5_9FABA|nr:uncharacterized protein G2W53_017866 [Senna tora]